MPGNSGIGCPNGTSGDLVAVKIGAASPPTLSVAWCADSKGQGSPIVTTTDGTADVVVWAHAALSTDQRLYGFDGDTGAVVFGGGGPGDATPNLTRRYQSPIAVHGRILVAADDALYAFKPQ
jgi:hypothetical protein